MSTLHIIRTSAFVDNKLKQCTDLLHSDDRVCLIDDGAYNTNHSLISAIANKVSVIKDHLVARNVSPNEAITIIEYSDLVTATINAEKVITWQ